MNKRESKGFKKLARVLLWSCSLLVLLVSGAACSGFGIGGVVPNDQPVTAAYPAKPASEYGKFIIYHVGEGEVKTLQNSAGLTQTINYHVTDLPYRPSMVPKSDEQLLYNINHPCGDGYDNQSPPQRDPEQTIFYKDKTNLCSRSIRQASDHPEAIVLNDQLYFFYTNYPVLLRDPFTGIEYFNCFCLDSNVCAGIDGTGMDFSDIPNDPNQPISTLGGLNCYLKDTLELRTSPGYDQDWLKIPISQFGLKQMIPLKIKIMGDQLDMKGARTIELSLFETAAGGAPDPSTEKAVASSRFGLDLSRMRDPVVGYMARSDRDYWLEIIDWEAKEGVAGLPDYRFMVVFESTPAVPVTTRVLEGATLEIEEFDHTSYIYRAGLRPAKSGNSALANGPSFEPDDVTTKVQDLYPDCDGVPDTGDEGDWGLYEVCPVEGGGIIDTEGFGIQDGAMQYFEVDNKSNIDDGESFRGVKTNLPSIGDEAPSIIKVGDRLWMFISTGSGIFQLSSTDGLNGLEWEMSNIRDNRPSLLPRSMDPKVPGDPNAPVVSSGRYGFCDTKAEKDDIQAVPKGKGYPDVVCATFGDDGVLDSYAMADEEAQSNGQPVINSGPDGVINSWLFPGCVSYRKPVYTSYYQIKTEGPGNPDLFCGDSVLGANDESAYLRGDDQWATNAIGLNPPEYWRSQNCNAFTMSEQFNQCVLGGKSEAVSIAPGGDGVLQTAQDFMEGDDRLCHNDEMTGICPGPNKKFDAPDTESILRILKKVAQPNDELCEISPAGGLEYARFKYADSVQLKHDHIVPGSPIVVSWYRALYQFMAAKKGWPALAGTSVLVPGTDYDLNPDTGELTMLGNNWLQPIANLPFDAAFFGDPNSRLKDVLIVYYRYQGAQVGVCPGADGFTDTTRYFVATYYLPDHFIEGPALELSLTMGLAFGANRINVPRLGDTYVDNVSWDKKTLTIACNGTDCPIAPGSDNTLDGAWVQDGNLNWTLNNNPGSYIWPPSPGAMANTMTPYIAPHRFDLYGQEDDWLCPIDGQWALCPGGNGFFQIYQLWKKVEVKKYDGVDDLLANYEKSDNPCYILEVTANKDEFYESTTSDYIQYSYRGVMEDDQVSWNEDKGGYDVNTGINGVNQSCASPSDNQTIPRYQGLPYQKIIGAGGDGALDSVAMKDNLFFQPVDNERPIPKITAGEDGICNSFRIGDDRMEFFLGAGAPDYPCVLAGPNGYANTTASGNDTQLYLPGEKTGFDSYQVDTPEVAQDGDKLYLYYSGLGWMKIPKSVPPGRGAVSGLGECKRPGLDDRWGNLQYTWSTDPSQVQPRSLLTYNGSFQQGFYNAVDDNQGVLLAPRIGVATSTTDRIGRNPSDWDRNLEPTMDAGGLCQAMVSGDILSLLGGLVGGGQTSTSGDVPFPPIFNYQGSFSPEVLIKYNEADDTPLFLMFVNGIYMIKASAQVTAPPAQWNAGLFNPEYQVGLARSTDGIHYQLANDINPLLVSGDLNEDLDAAFGMSLFSGKARASILNPTVFEEANDSYGMIFKTFYLPGASDYGIDYPSFELKSNQEWLGFSVRSGAIYSGGLAGLISCNLNPGQLRSTQGFARFSAGALLLLPLAVFILFKLRRRQAGKN